MPSKPLTPPEELARRLGWPGWFVMGVLSQVGAGIGALSSDLYWTTRWYLSYHGRSGRLRWQAKVNEWRARWDGGA